MHTTSSICRSKILLVAVAIHTIFGLSAAQAGDLLAAAPLPAPAHTESKSVSARMIALAPVSNNRLPTEIAPPMQLALGKSTLLRVPEDLGRISVGNPEVADVILLNPREVYLLGKHAGSTNVFLWNRSGKTTVIDVSVGVDTVALKEKLKTLLPGEKNITVEAAGESLVLSGQVSDAVKVQRAVVLAEQFGGKKVVNLMRTGAVPQVMLEVKVAEVSKTLVDKLGAQFNGTNGGSFTYSLLANLLTGASSTAKVSNSSGSITLDAERKNGLVKILAEPTIMAVSGQEGAFLAGGKIFIPVPQTGTSGTTITLEEKEFGVGLRFTPVVLDDGRINLRVTPEVSELSQVGTPFTSINGATSVLPTITTRRASTSVQLMDGQSFAIGGLIKNNVTEAMKALPILGEMPVLGALFRSSEFQTDRSELLFIVTPRLVKPLNPDYALPTDSFVPPTRGEFFLNGQMEGKPVEKTPAATAGRHSEFELK
ncbi:MAG: type II and III secretion system protein family protein [Burkholderiales bacterium]|nr:type II and III secretion system protein family protein [Burkholderiales bacterium]